MSKSGGYAVYLIKRLLGLLLVMWMVATLVFVLLRLIPGDPVQIIAGIEVVDKAVLDELRRELGLDQPIFIQYVRWVSGIFQGDLGKSIRTSIPVSEYILKTIPVSLQLATFAFIIGIGISVPAGAIAARNKGKIIDIIATSGALIGISTPSFVLGLLLIYIFSVNLKILPSMGYVSFFEDPIRNLQLMLLPSLTLGLITAGNLVRVLRRGIIDQSGEDYVRTARAKGAKESQVFHKHILRNAIMPFITMSGIELGIMLSGTVITESIFAIPGMGRLIITNIGYRDYPVVQGAVFIVAIIYVLLNLIIDLLYTLLDPRVKLK